MELKQYLIDVVIQINTLTEFAVSASAAVEGVQPIYRWR